MNQSTSTEKGRCCQKAREEAHLAGYKAGVAKASGMAQSIINQMIKAGRLIETDRVE